jgi:hypothetical protein
MIEGVFFLYFFISSESLKNSTNEECICAASATLGVIGLIRLAYASKYGLKT